MRDALVLEQRETARLREDQQRLLKSLARAADSYLHPYDPESHDVEEYGEWQPPCLRCWMTENTCRCSAVHQEIKMIR